MLIVGYCYGIRSERRLTQEVELHLAYRWFCKLDLEDEIPHHTTFSLNRLGRFRESDVLRHVFERVVWAAMTLGLVNLIEQLGLIPSPSYPPTLRPPADLSDQRYSRSHGRVRDCSAGRTEGC